MSPAQTLENVQVQGCSLLEMPLQMPNNIDQQIPQRRQLMRISCTHINMDIIHVSPTTNTNQACDLCGRRPEIGWLYACRQDHAQSLLANSSHLRQKAIPPFRSDENEKNTYVDLSSMPLGLSLVDEMQEMKFSKSILKQASEGLYTEKQLNLLKTQKLKVMRVIEAHQRANFAVEDEQHEKSLHPNVTVRKRKNSKVKRHFEQIAAPELSRCVLRCCHTCRPYYWQRTFVSLDAVINDPDDLHLGPNDHSGVKIINAAIARQLGIRRPKDRFTMELDLPSDHANTLVSYLPNVPDFSTNLELPVVESSHENTLIAISSDNNDSKLDPLEPQRKRTSLASASLSGLTTTLKRIGKNYLGRFKPSTAITRRVEKHHARNQDHDINSATPATTLTSSRPRRLSELSFTDGIALSEIAVEEHVPDLITQA